LVGWHRRGGGNGGGIDVQVVPGDDSGAFEPLHPFGDGERRHAGAPGQFGHRHPRAGLQLAK